VQLPTPATALYVPAVQLVHITAPTVAFHIPGAQAVQVPAPVTALYVPGAQAVQLPVPVPVLYFPTSHGVQATPSAKAVYPTLQIQLVAWILPAEEDVLAGQGVLTALVHHESAGHVWHINTPMDSLYFPTPHALQLTPSDKAVYPARHVQFVSKELLTAENVLFGHAVQLANAIAVSAVE
jgi:hypothetical protein